MYLILFGPPGVGKGTQAKIIANKFSIPHISTGDILRQAIVNETELGKQAKSIMDEGKLLPDEIIVNIVREVLNNESCKRGFILDGFPRTVKQAEDLEIIFNELKLVLIKIIDFFADENLIVERMTNRRVCKNCNSLFNLLLEKIENDCPKCGYENSVFQRNDDKEDVIRNRFNVYRQQTLPVKNYYIGKHEIISINAIDEITNVTNNVLAKL